MSRSFDVAVDYQGTVASVHRAFGDQQYWRDRLAASGADAATLDALEVGADGSIVVVTTTVLVRERLPGLVTQFHRGDLEIERREMWGPVSAGQTAAKLDASIPNAPVNVVGDATLAPGDTPGRSKLQLRAAVEVAIPLVGGKIESIIGGYLSDVMIAEQRFTAAWLAGNH